MLMQLFPIWNVDFSDFYCVWVTQELCAVRSPAPGNTNTPHLLAEKIHWTARGGKMAEIHSRCLSVWLAWSFTETDVCSVPYVLQFNIKKPQKSLIITLQTRRTVLLNAFLILCVFVFNSRKGPICKGSIYIRQKRGSFWKFVLHETSSRDLQEKLTSCTCWQVYSKLKAQTHEYTADVSVSVTDSWTGLAKRLNGNALIFLRKNRESKPLPGKGSGEKHDVSAGFRQTAVCEWASDEKRRKKSCCCSNNSVHWWNITWVIIWEMNRKCSLVYSVLTLTNHMSERHLQ